MEIFDKIYASENIKDISKIVELNLIFWNIKSKKTSVLTFSNRPEWFTSKVNSDGSRAHILKTEPLAFIKSDKQFNVKWISISASLFNRFLCNWETLVNADFDSIRSFWIVVLSFIIVFFRNGSISARDINADS